MNRNSKIGIGTVQFGMKYGISNLEGQTTKEEVNKILTTARENGIKIIDTASAYGASEEILGMNDLSEFLVVSKFIPPADNEKIHTQLIRSLKNLRIDSLYGYLAHSPLDLINYPERWKELEEYKKSGLIQKIGFSLYNPSELKVLLKSGFFPDIVQIPFSYFDKRFAPELTSLKKLGCEIHSRSVFLQGLFFMDVNKLSSFFDEVKTLIESLQHHYKSHLPAVLLNHVVSNSLIDCVIIGVENKLQLAESLSNCKFVEPLPKLEVKISEKILLPSEWIQN